MEIGLGHISSPPNKIVKDYREEIRVSNVVLKIDTSVRNPVFILDLDEIEKVSDISNINYLHWFQTGRYYYVTDIRFLRGRLVELACRCDVLYTFRDDILNSTQFCVRSGNKFTSLLPDENYQILNEYNTISHHIADCTLPTGSRHWVLQTATS